MKSKRFLVWTGVLLIALTFAVSGDDRPEEGKIVGIDTVSRQMLIQGEDGDQWTLYWTESVKLEDDLTFPELKAGDRVHFEFVLKDGKMWITELHRTKKAD
jgi:Cu/Ag efflux protein CusF